MTLLKLSRLQMPEFNVSSSLTGEMFNKSSMLHILKPPLVTIGSGCCLMNLTFNYHLDTPFSTSDSTTETSDSLPQPPEDHIIDHVHSFSTFFYFAYQFRIKFSSTRPSEGRHLSVSSSGIQLQRFQCLHN